MGCVDSAYQKCTIINAKVIDIELLVLRVFTLVNKYIEDFVCPYGLVVIFLLSVPEALGSNLALYIYIFFSTIFLVDPMSQSG